MKILINNEEVICSKDFTIEQEMLSTPSVILNNVYPKTWETSQDYVSNFYYPEDYSKCLIYDENNTLLFAGVVENTGDISLNPRQPHYCNLQVLDFKTFLSEGETLDFVIANKTVTEAIEQVVSTVSDYGFVVGNIDILNPNEVIGAYSTKDKTAYDVFQYLADITQSRWTTRMIDADTVAIDFYDPTLMPEGTAIEYTNEWFENNDIHDMTFSYASRDYRNKQIMTSDEVYGNIMQTENIIANGYQMQFNTTEKIGEINSITIDGVSYSVTTKENKELGIVADFYYTSGEMFFESSDLQSAGSILTVVYTPIVLGRQIIINASEISRISSSTGRNGIISRYENRNDAITSNELQQIGKSYIKYKGSPEITLTVTTSNNIWDIGQTVEFEAPIGELSTNYMVKKKTIKYIVAGTFKYIVYTYEMSSSFNSEQAINYFDNQRAKTSGNIGAGESIARQYDIENTANIIFYNTTFSPVQVIGDNILDCVLNSPFNN